MRTSRLEAFSDGVLAIVITIMVLELEIPDEPTWHAMGGSASGLLTYLLSFVFIGIYWNNHHHLFQLVSRVNGRILWANLLLLFALSLIPFSTRWMDEFDVARDPVVWYGLNLLAAALSYFVLFRAILAADGPDGHVSRAITRDTKERVSLGLYVLGIVLAFVSPWLGLVPYVVVALIWLVPDTRVERYLAAHEPGSSRPRRRLDRAAFTGSLSGHGARGRLPRCAEEPIQEGPDWVCPTDGHVPPLWRPAEASYDAFGAHLLAADGFPTYLPWPLAPGWRISDFCLVGAPGDRPLATMTCCTGASEHDGPVDVMVVAEEPRTGLGARCAGTLGEDPGPEVGQGPPTTHVRLGTVSVALWSITPDGGDDPLARSVLAGEAEGRWLWLVLRPAAALLMLPGADWPLRDVSDMGAPLLELEFGGPGPRW
ncbi:MAG: DUF6758 family protein [Nocardioides sp.]